MFIPYIHPHNHSRCKVFVCERKPQKQIELNREEAQAKNYTKINKWLLIFDNATRFSKPVLSKCKQQHNNKYKHIDSSSNTKERRDWKISRAIWIELPKPRKKSVFIGASAQSGCCSAVWYCCLLCLLKIHLFEKARIELLMFIRDPLNFFLTFFFFRFFASVLLFHFILLNALLLLGCFFPSLRCLFRSLLVS